MRLLASERHIWSPVFSDMRELSTALSSTPDRGCNLSFFKYSSFFLYNEQGLVCWQSIITMYINNIFYGKIQTCWGSVTIKISKPDFTEKPSRCAVVKNSAMILVSSKWAVALEVWFHCSLCAMAVNSTAVKYRNRLDPCSLTPALASQTSLVKTDFESKDTWEQFFFTYSFDSR